MNPLAVFIAAGADVHGLWCVLVCVCVRGQNDSGLLEAPVAQVQHWTGVLSHLVVPQLTGGDGLLA